MTNMLEKRVYEACNAFDLLEYRLEQYVEGNINIEDVLRIKEQLKRDLGKAVGLTEYSARVNFSIEE